MRIAAIYVPPGQLSHVFGIEHTGITINLGGKNLYKLNDGEIISIEPNPTFWMIFSGMMSLY